MNKISGNEYKKTYATGFRPRILCGSTNVNLPITVPNSVLFYQPLD